MRNRKGREERTGMWATWVISPQPIMPMRRMGGTMVGEKEREWEE